MSTPAPTVAERSSGTDEYAALVASVESGTALEPAWSRLAEEALAVWSRPGFDQLISLPHLRFEPFDYQLVATATALRRMRGRAILADEVGLGKTIEACLVLSELRLRGLARRVLVVVPAGLVEQWREELDRKFALPSVVAQSPGWSPDAPAAPEEPVVLVSLAAARRSPLRETMLAVSWDVVIVDEAHRLKNPASASARFARGLRARSLLLLTATPVENRLEDLFQLTSLVAPGVLGPTREFRARHGPRGADQVRNIADLRARLRDVMIRHRRSEVSLLLPRRLAETVRVQPAPDEADLYDRVSERVRVAGRHARPAERLSLRSAQRLAGSSPAALAPALDRLGWHDLASSAKAVAKPAKGAVLLDVVARHLARNEKVTVFTAFRHTMEMVSDLLSAAEIDATRYHGGLGRQQKEAAIEAFRGPAAVLVTTEAAGEGRNLQFCHVMVNFDLPWNPMQIEQRLGRIHRIGQEHDVMLVNLVSLGTIEERILSVLETKLNLFELVVGELDMILGQVSDDFDFERYVFDSHLASADDTELAGRLETLGDELARARDQYLDSRAKTDAFVGGAEDDP